MIRRVIIKNKVWYNNDTFGLEFYLPKINPLPGQFFQVRVDDTYDPFLNRPISVASYIRNRLRLIVRVVGKGTRMLGDKKEGERLSLFGPFGKGLKLKKKKSLIIAGGIGVAPLYFLAQQLKKIRANFTFIYGVKAPVDFILKRDISKLADKAIFVSETGSKDYMTAVAALKHIDLANYKLAYACGPRAMLIGLQKLNLPIPVHAFCEDFLGCGCGLCLGCAVMYKGRYRRICEDGPVFELEYIEFDERQ
jgi:dihydroorotate dehydrogenase electron transfer subunit